MDKQSVRDLVAGYSIETTVREAGRLERYADLVPAGTAMYIPHVPGVERSDTIALAARLRREGMDPVPHVVARRTESAAILDDFLTRLVGEAGVTRVLVVAGDIDKPEGEFESALQIIERGFIEKHGIRKVGLACHPEGHKNVADDALRDAIARKNAYARKTGSDVYLVSQFGFVADPIISWEKSTSWLRSNSARFPAGVIESSSSATCSAVSGAVPPTGTISPCFRNSGAFPEVRWRSEQCSRTIWTNSDSMVSVPVRPVVTGSAPGECAASIGEGLASSRIAPPSRLTFTVTLPAGAA